jgi:hypothetical protein
VYLSWETLTQGNLRACAPLWSDRPALGASEFEEMLNRAADLLRSRRANGALIRRGPRACAFGLSTFVERGFLDAYFAAPHPQVGKRLLLYDASAILSTSGIAAGNAGEGLACVVLSVNVDAADPEQDSLSGLVFESFMGTHRGYRLSSIVTEAFGPTVIDTMTTSSSFERRCACEHVGGVPGLESVLFSVTREQAAAWRTPLMSSFVYAPPAARFTSAEQEVLRTALGGATDEGISTYLGVPLTAVKARWTRIQQKVARRVPHVLSQLRESKRDDRRGPQARQFILEFVRRHPAELTPYGK